MKTTGKLYSLAFLAALGSLLLSACGPATPEPSPTPNIEAIQTSAVRTFSIGLTQTAILLPTDTPAPIPTDTPTTAAPLSTPRPPASGSLPTVSCYGLTFVKDVTIPDNTLMAPGQAFTKTWRVRNSGTCAWDTGFKFAFVGGNAMSGATLVLDNAVSPGTEKDLSIAMKAPSTTGSVRGTWRMSTAGGTYFGDQVFVLINVGGTVTVTPTITKTPTITTTVRTPTRTATATVSTNTPTATATATETTAPPTTSTPTPTETPPPTDTPTPGS